MSLLDSLFDGLARLIGLPDDRRDLAPVSRAIPLPAATSGPAPAPEHPSDEPDAPSPEPQPEPQPEPELVIQAPTAAPATAEPEPEPERPRWAELLTAAALELPKAELIAVVDLGHGTTLASRGPFADVVDPDLAAAARALLSDERLQEPGDARTSPSQAIVTSDDAIHVFARLAERPESALVIAARDPAQLGLTLAKIHRLVRAA